MKLYKLDDLFMFGGITKQSYPFIVIGEMDGLANYDILYNIFCRIYETIIPDDSNAREIDKIIATRFCDNAELIHIIGCTIRIQGCLVKTGGVLGNPKLTTNSADGKLDQIGKGWLLITFPGGPGIALKTDSLYVCNKIEELIQEGYKEERLLNKISDMTYKAGVKSLLALTDGTGIDAKGCALIRKNDRYLIWSLAEIKEL